MQRLTLLEKDPKLPWTVYVGAADLPGKTAFMGWKELSKAKKNFTPMRQKVIQFAKRDGLKVIASAGSEVKVEFMKKIGADVAFDYKTTDTRKVLAREGPIDVHVCEFPSLKICGLTRGVEAPPRFMLSGAGYNTGYPPIKNMHYTLFKTLIISGVMVFQLQAKYNTEFYAAIPQLLADGEIKYTDDVSRPSHRLFLRVFAGDTTVKAVVVVAEECSEGVWAETFRRA
ncbi:hypothetical protein FB451DRAFT_1187531 [Mycena latifolia]|nr:hypothetical protein FB451DRAFT_1187531 [Mycena latifolia]